LRVSGTRKRLALVLLCAASFVAVLDTTIVSVALPSMRRDLGFTTGDAQWILNGYALAFGGLLLLGGRAGDLYGRRRLFVAGLAVFAAASLVGGLASTPWVLVAARVLQGVGGAALAPASLVLVTTTFAGAQRNRALGIYSAMAGLGFVCGMVLGGVITQFLGWRWVMFVNVPVALAVLLPAPAVIPESRDERAPRALDVPRTVTATLGIAALIYAISEVPKNVDLARNARARFPRSSTTRVFRGPGTPLPDTACAPPGCCTCGPSPYRTRRWVSRPLSGSRSSSS
jgi:MFS family permease